jgi:hypothetical protein
VRTTRPTASSWITPAASSKPPTACARRLDPFSCLREKVDAPKARPDEGIAGPHPALRATFSREARRETGVF